MSTILTDPNNTKIYIAWDCGYQSQALQSATVGGFWEAFRATKAEHKSDYCNWKGTGQVCKGKTKFTDIEGEDPSTLTFDQQLQDAFDGKRASILPSGSSTKADTDRVVIDGEASEDEANFTASWVSEQRKRLSKRSGTQ